jgi:hypothetical protein
MFKGVHQSTSKLTQSLAEVAAIQAALWGPLGDLLAAEQLGGQPNPAAGRRPDPDTPVWAGGSLGGTMGMVYTMAHPEIRHAALNVPGAAWTHFIPMAFDYRLISLLFEPGYGGPINLLQVTAMAQIAWDPVDGAAWIHRWPEQQGTILVQESIGDPILPNPGSDMVAICVGATQVAQAIAPVSGLQRADSISGASGMTQFKVPQDWDDLDIHGFGSHGHVAGQAARAQIYDYFRTVWAGAPAITIPEACVDNGDSCDFSAVLD